MSENGVSQPVQYTNYTSLNGYFARENRRILQCDPQISSDFFDELCRMVLFEGPEFHDDFEEPHEHDDLVQRGELGIAWPVFHAWS